jgi:stromal interaction molecule 1
MEVSKLKEEVKVLRSELHRAEEELEDRPWVAPPLLQIWLQLIYETEVQQVIKNLVCRFKKKLVSQ